MISPMPQTVATPGLSGRGFLLAYAYRSSVEYKEMKQFSYTRLVRLVVLLSALVWLVAPGFSFADEDRRSSLQQFFQEPEASDRLERIENMLSGPCRCSKGEPLSGTQGLLFNCICGSMQCVVAGQRNGAPGGNDGFDLFCR